MATFNKEVRLPLFLRGYPNINNGQQQQQWLIPYAGNKSGPIISATRNSSNNSNHLVETLEMYPYLAQEQFSIDGGKTKHYPLVFLLSTCCGPSLTEIRKVYNMYPQALLPRQEQQQQDAGYHPLEAAIVFRCTSDIINFLILEYTGNEYEVDYDSERFLSHREDTDYTYPIHLLVHNFNGFGGDGQKFSKYFRLLYNASHPKTWKYSETIWCIILRNLLNTTGVPSNLLMALANNETENTFTIDFGRQVKYKESLIQNLQHFVPYLHRSCENLTFSGGYFDDFSSLDCFFSHIKFPPNLDVELAPNYAHFNLEDIVLSDLEKRWSGCQIQYLTIKMNNLHSDDFKCMVRSFQALPKLRRLSLAIKYSTGHNCTDAVVELLDNSKFLECLGLWDNGFEVLINVKELCCALKNSTASTAFVDYDLDNGSTGFYEQAYEIAYLSAMNQHGRAKIAAASTASLDLLVECLVDAEDCVIIKEEVGPCLEESLLYGLLREAPGLWASTPDSPSSQKKKKKKKKKKRGASNSLVEQNKTKKIK